MSHEEQLLLKLALGRIFRMMARPAQPGDVAEYERCRSLILDVLCGEGESPQEGYQPNWARDRLKGAAGD